MALMSKNNKNLSNALSNQCQRFSIRKLSIGAASVLLGTTLFLANGGVQVHADSVNDNNSAQVVNGEGEKDDATGDASPTASEKQEQTQTVSDNSKQVNTESTTNVDSNKVAEFSKAEENKTPNTNAVEKKAQQQVQATNQTADSNSTNADQTSEQSVSNSATSEKSNSQQDNMQEKAADNSKNETVSVNVFDLHSSNPINKTQLNTSLAATDPADEVSATFHFKDMSITDDDDNYTDVKGGTSITLTGKKGSTISDLIKAKIDADTQKQLSDYSGGYGYIIDANGKEQKIGLSPVVAVLKGQNQIYGESENFDGNIPVSLNDNADKILGDGISEQYQKWLDNKQKEYPLAGYIYDADNQDDDFDGDATVENNGDYTINLEHNNSFLVNKHFCSDPRNSDTDFGGFYYV